MPIGEVKVKVKHTDDVKAVADKIRRLNRGFDEVWDYTELKGTLDKIDGILSSVTYILLGIVLTISFFSLLTSQCGGADQRNCYFTYSWILSQPYHSSLHLLKLGACS